MIRREQAGYTAVMEPVPSPTDQDSHHIDPVKDSWYTTIGKPANLLDARHYPVEAVCSTCHGPIIAEHFLSDWAHFVRM
jgi:hypothetical protein